MGVINQTVKNQTVRSQKMKKTTVKVHQKMKSLTVKSPKKTSLKTTKKVRSQKVKSQKDQLQSVKTENGRNVTNSTASWEVPLNVLLMYMGSLVMTVPMLLTVQQKPSVSKTKTKHSHGTRILVTAVWLWMTRKVQMAKNQTKKNQMARSQTERNLKMMKTNPKLPNRLAKMANGKNVMPSMVSWVVLLNVLLIPVFLVVTMDPIQKVQPRQNVSKTRTKLSHGIKNSETVALKWPTVKMTSQKMTNLKTTNLKTTSQKLQHLLVKMANGKNVMPLRVLSVEASNALLIHVLLLVTMDPIQKVLQRQNVSRTRTRHSLGIRILDHVVLPLVMTPKTNLKTKTSLKMKLILRTQAARMLPE